MYDSRINNYFKRTSFSRWQIDFIIFEMQNVKKKKKIPKAESKSLDSTVFSSFLSTAAPIL